MPKNSNNYIPESIIKSIKALVKKSVSRNPGKNSKFIKNRFQKKLSKALKGKVVQQGKLIFKIKKVQVRRIKRKLRISIVTKPLWKEIDSKNQI